MNYRRNSDEEIRSLERQISTSPDPTLIQRLYHAKVRAGLPVCSACENPYVAGRCGYQPISTTPPERTQICGQNLCDDCIGNCEGCERLLCEEHRVICPECITSGCLPEGMDSRTRPECWPEGVTSCDICGAGMCTTCITRCESFEHEGEYYQRCGGEYCPSCYESHDCTTYSE